MYYKKNWSESKLPRVPQFPHWMFGGPVQNGNLCTDFKKIRPVDLEFGLHIFKELTHISHNRSSVYFRCNFGSKRQLGNNFLNEIFSTFPGMRIRVQATKHRPPYLYESYNVTAFTPNPATSGVKDIMARIINCLIKALNDVAKLPKFLLVVPDEDILSCTDYQKYGLELSMHVALGWIITQMEHALETKKEDLMRHKPGAVAFNEPKTIWVKMLNRVFDSENDDDIIEVEA